MLGFVLQCGMEGEPGDSPLDLSHLTEVEQSKILQVLQRDLDLRLRDEGRVRSEATANGAGCACTSDPPWASIRSARGFDPFWKMCRVLQETEMDQSRLRSMSGAWFMEERSKRHHTWSSSALVHATIRHKRTKNRGLWARVPAGIRVSRWHVSVVVAIVTDLPLIELFNSEGEKVSHGGCTPPEAERRLKDTKEGLVHHTSQTEIMLLHLTA